MSQKWLLPLLGYVAFSVAILSVPAMVGDNVFLLNKYARYLALALPAVALALCWGQAGILNLGQGFSFGIGAYAIAMHLKLVASASNPGGLPDFMGWNNVGALPWFWEPFHSLGFAVLAGIGVPVLLASLLGWFMFRARIAGVFVAIITLAMLVVGNLLVVDQQRYTGGLNGMTDLAWLNVLGLQIDPYSRAFYYLTAGSLIAVLMAGFVLVRSKFGLILQAIRGNPERVRYFGYDVARYQSVAFATSAGVAGIGGMLYAMVLEFASPTFMAVPLSLAFVIWCAVGGRQSLLAAAIGAVVVNAIQGSLSEAFLDTAQLLVGGIFVLVVLFLPRGLGGLVEDTATRLHGAGARLRRGREAVEKSVDLPVKRGEVAK
ncbi:urea ABC transporter permease subunit UrtC [Ectothiorhodospiraceae bacterium WFHF3C12]|nr:urea ABC transporter permease subunit UrtC [Ectothiorhodospiraceae bacterium WFHF3C12]